jgi:hypothetical protein
MWLVGANSARARVGGEHTGDQPKDGNNFDVVDSLCGGVNKEMNTES